MRPAMRLLPIRYRELPDGSLNGEATGFGKAPPGGIQEFAPTVSALATSEAVKARCFNIL